MDKTIVYTHSEMIAQMLLMRVKQYDHLKDDMGIIDANTAGNQIITLAAEIQNERSKIIMNKQ